MPDEQLTALNDDSPPDTVEFNTGSRTAPSTDFTFIDSLAEPEQETIQAPMEIKKGIGRPRKDGLPAKTDTLAAKSTPTPMYKRFYSDATNANQKPAACLRWCKALPSWVKERLEYYVYREFPPLKDPPLDIEGKKEDSKYIDKLSECPDTLTAILDKYGAGDYGIIVKDSVLEMRAIANIQIREGWRNFKENPPTDRRIDDVANVDLTDPACGSYVKFLKTMGKLPEQQQEKGRDADMAEASALKEMTGMMKGMVERVMDRGDRGNNDTTATVVKEVAGAMGETNKQISSMWRDAIEGVKAQQSDRVDPLEYIKTAVELMRPQQSQDNNRGGGNEVVDVLKTYLEIESKRAAAAEQRNHELMEKLMEKNNPAPPPPPPPQADALQTTEKTVESITKIANLLGLKARGEAAVVDGGSSWWKDNLPEIMQYGNGIIQAGVRAYEISQVGRARQQPMQAPAPPMPMHIVPSAAIPDGHQQFQPVEPEQPVEDAVAQQQPEDDGYNTFMAKIHEPLMNHIDKNLGGDAFAQWLIDGLRDGDAVYQQLKMQGAEIMIQGLKLYEPLWRELEPKQALLPKFVDEFMRMEELVAAAEEVEDAEWGGFGGNEEDEEPIASEASAGGVKLVIDR